jgi:hypothetical protein
MAKQAPTNYRTFSIEQERDGSFSLFRLGYIRGGFKSVADAQKDADRRLD